MKTNTLIGALTACGLAALLSCDNGASQMSGNLSDNDCPIGTFKPPGFTDCVIGADDPFGNPLGVSDNRCASGQPAFPPVCQSDSGGRTYFATSMTCATGYRYLPGACRRDGGFAGTGGVFPTGAAGAGPVTGFAGTGGFDPSGAAGGIMTGAGGDSGTGVGTGSGGTGG
jgi:hypothetical protein